MKKGVLVSIVALLAAAAGAMVAIAAFMKKRGRKLRDELDFDDIYLEDDSDMDCEDDFDMEGEESEAEDVPNGEADESIEADVDTDVNEVWEEAEEKTEE